ncbi:MAG: epoxyqueuosine reductase QueH [Oscillospiraceae bacterium]|nr:epoxyqueuosine reductase QueH [Oscillospiraceae bacterium]
MTGKRNYQREMDEILHASETPAHVLLHACCAPCSSACLERIADRAKITLFFYNPNIIPEEEYQFRLAELRRLVQEMPLPGEPVAVLEGRYDPERFLAFAKDMADLPERGERCRLCIRMRLMEAALTAKEIGADYFATTLTLSPHKDAPYINEAGFAIAEETGVAWLPSDFKKQEGYKRSIELSKQYDLYRQNFCGCPFSRKNAQDASAD